MLFPPSPPLNHPPRIVVTGAGLVTPLGVGWRVNADGFREGRTSFGPVTLFDVSRQRAKTAAQATVPACPAAADLAPKARRRLDRATLMLLHAAHEAWAQSGGKRPERITLVLGTTCGGMSLGEDYFRHAVRQPIGMRGQPTRAAYYQAQTQAQLVARALGLSGPVTVLANACASGANAIGFAWELLRRGQAQRVLTGGYDALSLLVFSGFDSLQALSPTFCRPFDARRDGLTLGEGAALMVLETLASAQRRDAEILGELIGYSAVLDLHHLTQPQADGDAAFAAMEGACRAGGLGPSEIDYVNAHGTGTVLNDSAEALAINRWAGSRVGSLPVSSSKAGIGHLLGAAGAVEAMVCLMTLREQWLPPELLLQDPDPLCRFPIVRQPQSARLDTVLSNSFGFGGANATLVFRRWN